MILVPSFDGCTFINGDKFCSVCGSLPDVLQKSLILEIHMERCPDNGEITIISPVVNSVSVIMDSPASRYCCDYLSSIGITPKPIERSTLKKVIKGET